jgi:hypothetical protein
MVSDTPWAYSVHPLTAISLPWRVRRRLRSARKKHRTGIIVYGIIRQGPRAISSKIPSVSVSEGKRWLGTCSSYSHRPKWAALAPGVHELLFLASRSASSSAFRKRVTLSGEDVLLAICEPVQPWTFYAKSPTVDTWYLGVIDSAGEIRLSPAMIMGPP